MEVRIKDIITDKISGEWGEEAAVGEGVKIIRTTNFTNEGLIDFEKIVYRKIDAAKITLKKLQKGDIIIEKSGGSPNQPVGRVVFFDLDTTEIFLCNNFTSVLRPDKSKVYPKYLFYQLFIAHIQKRTLRYQNKTTGIINLKLDDYLSEKIYVPEFKDQVGIVTILSKAEALIHQRKESIHLLNELLKSTFLKIFGDPPEDIWPSHSLDSLKLGGNGTFSNGPFGSDLLTTELTNSGVPVIYIRDIRNGNFNWKSNVYVTKDKARTLPSCKVISDDLLIAKVGDPPGISAIYPKGFKDGIITQDVIRIRLNKKLIIPFFLQHYLNSELGKQHIKKISIEGTRNRFSLGDFKKLTLTVPPIILQNQFAQIVEKVEALNEQYKTSLKELENLYGSLSQRAFKGDLDLNTLEIEIPKDKRYGDPMENLEMLIEEPKLVGDANMKYTQKKKQSSLVSLSPISGKIANAKFHDVEGHAIIEKYFKRTRFFDFTELSEKVKELGLKVTYEELKDFVFRALSAEDGVIEQFYSTPKWLKKSKGENPNSDDFASDGSIYFVYKILKQ